MTDDRVFLLIDVSIPCLISCDDEIITGKVTHLQIEVILRLEITGNAHIFFVRINDLVQQINRSCFFTETPDIHSIGRNM